MNESLLTGGCYCGRVRYRVPLRVIRFGFGSCHCSMCRRLHAAPFAMWTGLGGGDAEAFAVTDPAALSVYEATPAARRYFCSTCGTHTHLVYAEGAERWASEIHIATATIDDACIPALEAHVAATGKPRHVHVFFSDRAACLGDVDVWAAAPKFGGATGTERLDEPG